MEKNRGISSSAGEMNDLLSRTKSSHFLPLTNNYLRDGPYCPVRIILTIENWTILWHWQFRIYAASNPFVQLIINLIHFFQISSLSIFSYCYWCSLQDSWLPDRISYPFTDWQPHRMHVSLFQVRLWTKHVSLLRFLYFIIIIIIIIFYIIIITTIQLSIICLYFCVSEEEL